jgi:UDP-N-acetylglucosamine transferase subunit ALG13
MIFVTAGTQEPFDRLLKTIDEIAGKHQDIEFIVQGLHSAYKPQNIEVLNFITPKEFDDYVDRCKLIISHAGMGTIITALVKEKPIIVMPRLMVYQEHRNEHQLATAKQMEKMGYINVAYDEAELLSKFGYMWPDKLKSLYNIGDVASDELIKSINKFIKF